MNKDFWQGRWESGQIGFHEGAPNALLVEHASHLPANGRVLVPLAGKAEDMIFLRDRGLAVVGIEFVEAACRAFFEEHEVTPRIEQRGAFRVFAAAGIELWCGDFFSVNSDALGVFDAAYDRAALVAIQPTDRARYVDTLASLLKPRARVLLISLGYDQSKVDGPPFSVDAARVRALFRKDFVIEPLSVRAGEPNARMRAAGLEVVDECVYRITDLRPRSAA